jgi:hypothetical protein
MLVKKYKILTNNTNVMQTKTEWTAQINDLPDNKDIISQVMKDYLQIQKMNSIHMYLITKDKDGNLSFFENILDSTIISIRNVIQKMLSINATNLTVVFNKKIPITNTHTLKLICKILHISFDGIKFITK